MLRSVILVVLLATILSAPPARAGNDDSCDISVAPAATLLLPYFEVDFASTAKTARTTIFTVTNVGVQPQIAHVTLWTDWAYAALTFNVYLTPYDTQSINLYDIFTRGAIAPDRTQFPVLPITGPSLPPSCNGEPTALPPPLLHDLQELFTTGNPGTLLGSGCGGRLGGRHALAIGYATIDVVASCTRDVPGPAYIASDLLFDNVLIGDALILNPDRQVGNYATGNPLVHIRAVPEGGPPGSNPGTSLPYTFYDRYTAASPQTLPRAMDRRQPLPAVFAARWVDYGIATTYPETTESHTSFDIWREGVTGPSATACDLTANHRRRRAENLDIVRFDEHENTNVTGNSPCGECDLGAYEILPPTSSASTSDAEGFFPRLTSSGDLGGWMYLNLDNGGSNAYSNPSRASQNWVIVDLYWPGRFAMRFDAVPLGNGCSARVSRGSEIGPAGGTPVCPAGAVGCTPGVAPYTGSDGRP